MIEDMELVQFRYLLRIKMEDRFGPAINWPHRLHVTHSQLEQLRQHTTAEFDNIVDCIAASLELPPSRVRRLPMDAIARTFADHYGTDADDQPAEVDAAWAILFGLHVYRDQQFQDVMRALIESRNAYRPLNELTSALATSQHLARAGRAA